jgi:hypothetical protein
MLSAMPSRRQSSAIEVSLRRPSSTMRIFSSTAWRFRVAGPLPDKQAHVLDELVTRRRQVIEMMTAEGNRARQIDNKRLRSSACARSCRRSSRRSTPISMRSFVALRSGARAKNF